MIRQSRFAVAALAAVALSGTAIAKPALTGTAPAADTTAAPTTALRLDFSEPVSASSSKVDLAMTSMPGMANMPQMRMKLGMAASADRKSLLLTAKAPLPPGTYKLSWATAGADKSQATGSFDFTIK